MTEFEKPYYEKLDQMARAVLADSADDYAKAWTPEAGEDGNSEPITEPLIVPIKFVELDECKALALGTPMPTGVARRLLSGERMKNMLMSLIRQGFEHGVHAWMISFEAWYAEKGETDTAFDEPITTLRHRTDVSTAVILAVHTQEGSRMYRQAFRQGKHKGPIHLIGGNEDGSIEPIDPWPMSNTFGRMALGAS